MRYTNSEKEVIRAIKVIRGKTKDELIELGYELYIQCDGGTVAYVVCRGHMSLIAILQVDGTFQIDYDQTIYNYGVEMDI